jgi:hypothetical protein
LRASMEKPAELGQFDATIMLHSAQCSFLRSGG